MSKSTDSKLVDLSGLGLREVPSSLFNEENRKKIISLDLSGNSLESLPGNCFHMLTSLRQLNLSRNYFENIPKALTGCAELENLILDQNRIRLLDVHGITLPKLRRLSLGMTGLEQIDSSISKLEHLQTLNLTGNLIGALPDSISRLDQIQELHLGGNPGFSPGEEITHLRNLQYLDLSDNKLKGLPLGLGHLPTNIVLNLTGNFFDDNIQHLASRGSVYLLAYLRSGKAEPHYEAKLIVVGEGNVGKTSMVEALMGRPFIEGRSTTHGIEIKTLKVRPPSDIGMLLSRRFRSDDSPSSPDSDIIDITIRSWDFGGQEIYRVTHQFFFSSNSLYVVAWRPREGQEANAVEDWIKRIKIRCGDSARVLIVATYGEERQPEIDYSKLQQRYAHLLVGHHRVDSRTGKGIPELKEHLVRMAAGLPTMGERISVRWLGVQDELLSLKNTYIARSTFDRICERHSVDEQEAEALAGLLNDLGYVVYYPEDNDLRDIMILQPEWLTKGISHILEDGPTRTNLGILDHRSLPQIWGAETLRLKSELHPYFLRLMEKFDISYRVSGDDASLIAQLVPGDRPVFHFPAPGNARDELALYCDFSEEPTGLIPWLTVRTRRFSVMKHWRKGFYLEHPEYDARALAESVSPTRLAIRVVGGSRSFLFDILRDTLEQLIKSRWPGLTYRLRVPCVGEEETNMPCEGSFPLANLELMRARGEADIRCAECLAVNNVGVLLVGFSTNKSLSNEMVAATELRQIGTSLRALLLFAKAANAEVTDCPRLFTLTNEGRQAYDTRRAFSRRYLLHLWCEEPGSQHSVGTPYIFSASREWFEQVAPYLRVASRAVSLFAPIAGGLAGVLDAEGIKNSAQLMKSLADAAGPLEGASATDGFGQNLSPAEGAALRRFRELLLKLDKGRDFRGLQRAFSPTGEWLWLCPEHYRTYEPPLPQLPA